MTDENEQSIPSRGSPSVEIARKVAAMARHGAAMIRHPWKSPEDLTDAERVCICLAAGVQVSDVALKADGVQITMMPASISIDGDRYVVRFLG